MPKKIINTVVVWFLISVFFHKIILKTNYKNNSARSADKKCIFVSGMPRSGTTILTHIISNFNDVGSFNYSDLAFTKIPFIWSKINWLYYNLPLELIYLYLDYMCLI